MGVGGLGGVHRIIIRRQNKSRPCLPIRASPVLCRNPFHLGQFQGCRESKATQLLRRPNSCSHSDLVAGNAGDSEPRVLDRMVGISRQYLRMYPIRKKKKNNERSKTAQPRRLALHRAPSAERHRLEYIYYRVGREMEYFHSGAAAGKKNLSVLE